MLKFNKNQTNLIISGKTFYARELIKAIGGKWDPSMQSWMLPVHIDSEMLRKDITERALLVEKEAKKKEKEEHLVKRAYETSPEGIAETKEKSRQFILSCLEDKTGAYHWICCENCKVIDWQRQTTYCMACAEWGGQSWNAFRVRGSIFTGD